MKNPRIVVTQDMHLSDKDVERLNNLGEVTFYNEYASSGEEWLEWVKDADIILSGTTGMKEKIGELENVFVSIPFVGIGWLDIEELRDRNIQLSNAPGCNRHAVSEWIIGMMINLVRKFPEYIDMTDSPASVDKTTVGLNGRRVLVLGKGNIGTHTGDICKEMDMEVDYFGRGDELFLKAGKADIVINTLSSNESTHGLLDDDFFNSMKQGSYFITITSNRIYSLNALTDALDKGHIVGAASDAGSIVPNDSLDSYYLQLRNHPKILATPHIAAKTEASDQIGNDIMIKNVEKWLEGNPINLIY